MNPEQITHYTTLAIDTVVSRAPTVLGAIATLIIGLRVIKWTGKIVNKGFTKTNMDITVSKFLSSIITVALKILLFISVAGMFGIQTTSFIALIGAAGLAIGMALQGSLANFAGGVLILLFKPYKIGDVVDTQGVFGTVQQISIFTTTILTPENKTAIIPNGPISNGNIVNITTQGNMRVDVNVGIAYDEDIDQTRTVLTEVIKNNTHIDQNHAGNGVFVNELADSSVNLIVRAFTHPAHYRDVYFGMTEESKKALDKANISIPFPHRVVHTAKE